MKKQPENNGEIRASHRGKRYRTKHFHWDKFPNKFDGENQFNHASDNDKLRHRSKGGGE